MDKQQLRQLATKLAADVKPENYIFDTDDEKSAFRSGSDYGIECAIQAIMKLLENDKAA